MAIPDSPTDFANMALDKLGERPIEDVENPTTDTGRLVRRHFDKCRRSVLRKYTLNFARTSASAPRSGDGDGIRYSDSYTLPTDCLKLETIMWAAGQFPELFRPKHALRGRDVFVNNSGAATLPVFYVKDETDLSIWDSIAVDVFVLTLALSIAFQVTKKKDVVLRVNEELKAELRELMSANGQENPPQRVQPSRILLARRRLSGTQFATKYVDFDD